MSRKGAPWRRFGLFNLLWDWRALQFGADGFKRSGRTVRLFGVAWGWFVVGFIYSKAPGEPNGDLE